MNFLMPSVIRKDCLYLTHGASGTIGSFGTYRSYGAHGTLGIN
jgi:hypothetical protein